MLHKIFLTMQNYEKNSIKKNFLYSHCSQKLKIKGLHRQSHAIFDESLHRNHLPNHLF
jgi:hypothetical protein